jgi:glucosyl-3-phosphoglycerate synthase
MAGEIFWQKPSETNLIPNWHRVTAALPDFFNQLRESVKEDNKS